MPVIDTGLSQLDLTTLAEIDDGVPNILVRKQLLIGARDLIDRDKGKAGRKTRTLTLKVHLIRLVDADDQPTGVAVEFEVVPIKLPSYVTHPHKAALSPNGIQVDVTNPDADHD